MNIGRIKSVAIILISFHSLVLGLAMLFFPRQTLSLVGWENVGALFFPSQSGIFLTLCSVAYFYSLKHPPLVWFIVFSKVSAVAFLVSTFLLGIAPGIALLAGFIDGLMVVILTTLTLLETPLNN